MASNRKTGQTGSRRAADKSAANTSSDAIFGVVMLGAAALLPWYFELPLNFDPWSPDFNPLIFAPVVLAFVGVTMLVKTTRSRLRGQKFGDATLAPDGGRRGGGFRPTVRTDIDVAATGDFVFELKCIRRMRASDDFEGKTSDKVLWKQATTSPADGRSSQGVTANFVIPGDVLPTGTSSTGGKTGTVRWLLTVSAPARGVNFHAEFPVTIR